MKSEQNIMELILSRKDKLSKGHKKIAEYILENKLEPGSVIVISAKDNNLVLTFDKRK